MQGIFFLLFFLKFNVLNVPSVARDCSIVPQQDMCKGVKLDNGAEILLTSLNAIFHFRAVGRGLEDV